MKIVITMVSLLLLLVCASFISGPIRNFSKVFLLFFAPDRFVKMSVEQAVTNEKKTNQGFKERFESNEDYRKSRLEEFSNQFIKSTDKIRQSVWKSFQFVFLITFLSVILAFFTKQYVFISAEVLTLIQIFSSFLILWSLLGQLGWTIQTIDGTTLPEQVNDYWFRFLNCVGIGLFFFSCFYQCFSSEAVPRVNLKYAGLFVIGGGILLSLSRGISKLMKKLLCSQSNPPTLSIEEIMTRLEIEDEQVINEIYEITRKQLSEEEGRRSSIDSKANNLAGMIGVYLSVLFGLTGLDLSKFLFKVESNYALLLYTAVCLLATVALMFALWAARARSDLRKIAESDVFNADVIKEGILFYKRYMATHYWTVYRNNFTINENKGSLLKRAYLCFSATVILLTVLAITSTIDYKNKRGEKMTHEDLSSDGEQKPIKKILPSQGDLHTANEVKKTPLPSDGEKMTESKD